MVRLYFLGGEDIEKKRDSKSINKRAFTDAGGNPSILIFPWTGKFTTAKKNKYRKSMANYFKQLGASKIIFAELTDSSKKIKNKIKSANLIYLPGGEPKFIIKRFKNRKIDFLLKKYNKIIMGNSAGSLALCKKYVVIKGQDGRPKTAFENGLGLTDFAVSVHYGCDNKLLSGESPTKELVNFSKKNDVKIYAIPETSAIVYNGKTPKFIGKVYLFYKGKKVKMKW